MPRPAHRHTFPPAPVLPLPEVPDGAWNHDLANANLGAWVARTALLTRPDEVVWVDGSDEQWRSLITRFTLEDDVVRLDPGARPGSLLFRSTARSTATAATPIGRSERRAVLERVAESMRGRTMYVVPFRLGSGDVETLGVHITDAPASVATLRAVAHIGTDALDAIGPHTPVVRTVDATLRRGRNGRRRRADARAVESIRRTVQHDTATATVWLLGSDDGAGVLTALHAHTRAASSVLTLVRVRGASAAITVGITGRAALTLSATTPAGNHVEFLAAGAMQVDRGRHGTAVAHPMTIGALLRVSAIVSGSAVVANAERDAVFTDTALTEDGDVWWPGFGNGDDLQLIDHRGRYLPHGGDPALAGAPDATVAVHLGAEATTDAVTLNGFVVTDPVGAADIDRLSVDLEDATPMTRTAWGGAIEITQALDTLYAEIVGIAAIAPTGAARAERELAA